MISEADAIARAEQCLKIEHKVIQAEKFSRSVQKGDDGYTISFRRQFVEPATPEKPKTTWFSETIDVYVSATGSVRSVQSLIPMRQIPKSENNI